MELAVVNEGRPFVAFVRCWVLGLLLLHAVATHG